MIYDKRTDETTDVWLTPPELIHSLGEFDLDPCSPESRPWNTAKNHYDRFGLESPWLGRVWLNPPYGIQIAKWMQRLAEHGNGIALIFARTGAGWFFEYVWKRADAIMFLRGRVTFHRPDGSKSEVNSPAASVLVAYGAQNVSALINSGLDGYIITLGPLAIRPKANMASLQQSIESDIVMSL